MTNIGNKKNGRKKFYRLLLNLSLAAVCIGFIWWGISVYLNLDDDLYTNNAQIEQYINPVNTRIPGYIREVRFDEHQQVKKGDTLLIIDDREYKIQLQQAQAAHLSALASKTVSSYAVNTVQSSVGTSEANVAATRSRLWNAKQNLNRYENLLKEGAATQQQYDQVKTDYDALEAQTRALEQQRNTSKFSTNETEKKIEVNDAEVKRTEALVNMAELNLSYTVITAPYDGYTGRRIVQEGQLLQAGQNLLSLIRNDKVWVVANYKETKIERLKLGTKMELTIDGLKDQIFYGTVTAISEATGSRFSSVPYDNSTGNFVKVQQRIPVKIEFINNENNAKLLTNLRAGMNVEVRLAESKND
ncbi:HlyD family secretion protein [Sphingobacterium siyangense]|uniref:Membrane fusion protein (Multidrug efflux system) n=1 Tax=Sphingobacterium siyangense TaxID=459529 RepID=A0A562MH10_9SPHI|nr:HlyD family secretion protein [Sphingobacterium siyangense]TWI19162.1 membrane fusion protein (multidrug efflux system) [Sphingobacterium siyangense]